MLSFVMREVATHKRFVTGAVLSQWAQPSPPRAFQLSAQSLFHKSMCDHVFSILAPLCSHGAWHIEEGSQEAGTRVLQLGNTRRRALCRRNGAWGPCIRLLRYGPTHQNPCARGATSLFSLVADNIFPRAYFPFLQSLVAALATSRARGNVPSSLPCALYAAHRVHSCASARCPFASLSGRCCSPLGPSV